MKFKKIMALSLTSVMLLSFAGCNKKGVETVVTANESEVGAGLYLNALLESHSELFSRTGKEDKELLDLTYQDKKGSEWISEQSVMLAKVYLVLDKEMEASGISLTEEEKLQVKNQLEMLMMYNESYYKDNGIGEKSLETYLNNTTKLLALFKKQYDTNGITPVSDADLKAFDKDNTTKVQMYQFPLVNKNNKAISADQKSQIEVLVTEMASKANAGEDLNALLTSYTEQIDKIRGVDPTIAGLTDEFISKNRTDGSFTEALRTQIIQTTDKNAQVNIDEEFITVYKVADFTEEDFASRRDTILSDMKKDEYVQFLLNKYKDTPFVVNEEAVSYYTPDKIK